MRNILEQKLQGNKECIIPICIAISINVHKLLNVYENTKKCFTIYYIVPFTSKYAE